MMLKKIKANPYAFAIWTMISCVIHILLFKSKVNSDYPILQRILMAVAVIAVSILVHEFIHFVFMKMFYKGKVRVVTAKDRLGIPMVGVMAEGEALNWQEVIMRLAPFVLLTLLPDIIFIFCTEIELVFFIVAIGNSAGCFYDILDACMVVNKKDKETLE